jgi:hypothetical protein
MAQLKWALALWIAGTGIRLAAASPETLDLSTAFGSGSSSGWVLADFNGDLRPDLASAHLTHHDARGYAQEVRVTFGRSGQTAFTFNSRAAKVEINAWDIDGDDDRDIVVLEALSRRPVGVWLNDGAGAFEEADLESFAKWWVGDDLPMWRVNPKSNVPFAIAEQRGQGIAPAVSTGDWTDAAQRLSSDSRQNPRHSRGPNLRTRAPPRYS